MSINKKEECLKEGNGLKYLSQETALESIISCRVLGICSEAQIVSHWESYKMHSWAQNPILPVTLQDSLAKCYSKSLPQFPLL